MSIEEVIPDQANAGWNCVFSNLNNSYLDPAGVPKLEIIKAYKICNPILEDSYRNKVNEFVASGCKDSELETKIGFFVENDCKEISEFVQNGISTRDSDNNTIGYNCMGVYLCKYLDVCLKHALAKMASVDHYKIIVCQYVTGKTTTAIPRAAVMGDFIEPTINFTSHISTLLPSPKDSIQTQFDRSQVYLYELDDQNCATSTPRHVMPLWVVVYGGVGTGGKAVRGGELLVTSSSTGVPTKIDTDLRRSVTDNIKSMGEANPSPSGAVAARVEAQMARIVSKETSCNERLQRVIDQINSRGAPQQPSRLQQAIDNINNKGQAHNGPYYDIDDVTGDYEGTRLGSLNASSQHISTSQLGSLSTHLTNSHFANPHLSSHHHLSSETLLPSINLISNLNEPLYYCSDTNNIFDVNSILALANHPNLTLANHSNITTLLPMHHQQQAEFNPSSSSQQQQQHDYYPLNYFSHSAKHLQQQQQHLQQQQPQHQHQEIMFASSSSSLLTSSSASSSSLHKKRGNVDSVYHPLFDKKVRIM